MSTKTPEKTIHAIEVLFNAGKTRHEIAELLGLSYNTVKGLVLAYRLQNPRQKEREPAPPPEQKELPFVEKELQRRLTKEEVFELIDKEIKNGHKVRIEMFD